MDKRQVIQKTMSYRQNFSRVQENEAENKKGGPGKADITSRAVLLYSAIREALEASVRRNLAEGLLLSGGLDTTILAAIAARWSNPDCITVAYKGSPAPDIPYSRQAARLFRLNHYVHYFGDEELEEAFQQAITILKSFDPMEIRNSAAAFIALKTARDRGLVTVITGDGGDELLAGYSFFFDMTTGQLEAFLKSMWANMKFASVELASHLGIQARLPFLDPEFKSLAMGLDIRFKVNREKDQVYGKWILRKAFESLITPELAWRVKAPLEEGAGTAMLPSVFESRITDSEFRIKSENYLKEDRVRIRSKEHLHYYEIYRKVYGAPGLAEVSGRKCPGCSVQVREGSHFCRVCGEYPI